MSGGGLKRPSPSGDGSWGSSPLVRLRRPFACLAALAIAGGCGRIGYEAVAVADGGLDTGRAEVVSRRDGGAVDARLNEDVTAAGDSHPDEDAQAPGDAGPVEDVVAAPDLASVDLPPPDMPSAVDSGPDVVACSEAFSPPEVIVGLGLVFELYGPRPRADALGLYLSATRGVPYIDEDIFFVTRAGRSDDFGRAGRVDELNSGAQDGAPFPAVDDMSIFFTSSRPGGRGRRDLWTARRATASAPFGDVTNLVALNSEDDDQGPSLTADGRTLFFASDRRDGTGGEDIWMASRPNATASFAIASNVSEINTAGIDSAPFVTGDGLTLYFVSDRPGGRGLKDIWRATRTTPTGRFDRPSNVTEVNSAGVEDDPALTADGRELFFASGRGGGTIQIWHALRCQ
jgi:hypothetical protein